MTLSQTQVQCYLTHLAPSDTTLALCKRVLSAEEQERANKFLFEHHRTHFIAAHGFLRFVLGHALHQDPRQLQFSFGPHRKPFLADNPLTFNLSHSGEYALLALGTHHPLGIDIEHRQKEAKPEVANRLFSEAEQHHLAALQGEAQRLAFYDIWSRKEAVVKGIGTGLHQSLSSFTVPLGQDPAIITVDDHPWKIWPLSVHPDYASALATHPDIEKVSFWQWVDGLATHVDQKNP